MRSKEYFLGITLCLLLGTSFGQEASAPEEPSDPSLDGKFQNMVETAETFQNYKVIRRDRLGTFWSEVTDTLVQYGKDKSGLESQLSSAQGTITELENQLAETQQNLDQVTFDKDRISFLGMALVKSNYSFIVWGIILLLAILVAVVYVRFLNASRITDRVKRDNQATEMEFEEYKKRSREKETKLKRELQTELNTVEELKQKVTLKG